jgi:hypothetical protein
MSGSEHPKAFPWRASTLVLTCVVFTFGFAVAAGVLEVSRPAKPIPPGLSGPLPTPYVQCVRAASDLSGGEVLWVYHFAGGLPQCWAEIESEGHRKTLGPWVAVSTPHFGSPIDIPLPESIEGYVALHLPMAREQTYKLSGAVTRVKYPDNPPRQFHAGFQYARYATLPDLLPVVPESLKGSGGPGTRTIDDGGRPRSVPVGEDVQLNFLIANTSAMNDGLRIRLWLRFLTSKEIAALEP